MDWIDITPASLTAIFAVLYKIFGGLCLLYGNVQIFQMGLGKFLEVTGSSPMRNQDDDGNALTHLWNAVLIWSVQPLFYAFNTDFGFSSNPLRIFLPSSVANLNMAGEFLWYLFATLTLILLIGFSRRILFEKGVTQKLLTTAITVILCQILVYFFEMLR